MQFCNIKYYVVPLPRMKFVLGWGVPLLKMQGLWRLIALTFAGNTCLMNFSVVFVLDFQSLINRLCAKFHIAIFLHHVVCIAFSNRAQHIFHSE